MTSQVKLLNGHPREVAEILSGDLPPDTIPELRAALANALSTIAVLQDRIESLEYHTNEEWE